MRRYLSEWLMRVCDICLSLSAVILFLPLLSILIILLKLTGEGKVFYFQKRVGYKGRYFSLIKFATMVQTSPDIGTKELTLPDDPRVLPLGKILRKTKLNELPQLFNVIKGDLSLIGPRPQTEFYYNCFSKDDVELITSIKPGLSGIGSVYFRDEEELFRNRLDAKMFDEEVIMPYKGQLERWYAENISLGKYFKLIVLTIYVVITGAKLDLAKIFHKLPHPPDELTNTKL